MSYEVLNSKGERITIVYDGTLNKDTSLDIVGTNYSGYGPVIAKNFIKLLENFASPTAPSSSIPGQLWYDTAVGAVKFYDTDAQLRSVWKQLGVVTTGSVDPNVNTEGYSSRAGDFWLDTSESADGQLKIWAADPASGVLAWRNIGSPIGFKGKVAIEDIIDSDSVARRVIKFVVNNKIVSLISNETAIFTPAAAELDEDQTNMVNHFPKIYPGMNMSVRSQSTNVQYGYYGRFISGLRGDDVVDFRGLSSTLDNLTATDAQVQDYTLKLDFDSITGDYLHSGIYSEFTSRGIRDRIGFQGSTDILRPTNQNVEIIVLTGTTKVDATIGLNAENTDATFNFAGMGTQITGGVGIRQHLLVEENVKFNKGAQVGSNAVIGQDLDVYGELEVGSNATISGSATVSGNCFITGNLTVSGSQIIANTETVVVEDNLIQLNWVDSAGDGTLNYPSGYDNISTNPLGGVQVMRGPDIAAGGSYSKMPVQLSWHNAYSGAIYGADATDDYGYWSVTALETTGAGEADKIPISWNPGGGTESQDRMPGRFLAAHIGTFKGDMYSDSKLFVESINGTLTGESETVDLKLFNQHTRTLDNVNYIVFKDIVPKHAYDGSLSSVRVTDPGSGYSPNPPQIYHIKGSGKKVAETTTKFPLVPNYSSGTINQIAWDGTANFGSILREASGDLDAYDHDAGFYLQMGDGFMSLGGVIGNLKGNDIGRRGPDLKIFDVTDDAQTGTEWNDGNWLLGDGTGAHYEPTYNGSGGISGYTQVAVGKNYSKINRLSFAVDSSNESASGGNPGTVAITGQGKLTTLSNPSPASGYEAPSLFRRIHAHEHDGNMIVRKYMHPLYDGHVHNASYEITPGSENFSDATAQGVVIGDKRKHFLDTYTRNVRVHNHVEDTDETLGILSTTDGTTATSIARVKIRAYGPTDAKGYITLDATTDIDLEAEEDIHMTATAAEIHATAGTDIHMDAGSEFRVKTTTPTSYIESPTINVGTHGTTTDINLDSTNMDLGVRLGTTITMKGTNITLGTIETGVTSKFQGDDIEINPQNSGTVKIGTVGTNNVMTIGRFIDVGDKTTGTMNGYWTVPSGSRLQATYADLAERYEAEKGYEPGTVVRLGGAKEITETNIQCDPDVFGVISESPGFTMNAEAGNDETHPMVAMSGRVPCKVVGDVKKGQRLVSSHIPGVAIALDNQALNDVPSFAIIGRSLVDVIARNDEVNLIEIVVGKQ